MDDEKLVLITIAAIESEIDASESNGEMHEPATPLEIASRAQVDVGTGQRRNRTLDATRSGEAGTVSPLRR